MAISGRFHSGDAKRLPAGVLWMVLTATGNLSSYTFIKGIQWADKFIVPNIHTGMPMVFIMDPKVDIV